METNPLIALGSDEIAALIEHHLLKVHTLPDSPERTLHVNRAEHLNALREMRPGEYEVAA